MKKIKGKKKRMTEAALIKELRRIGVESHKQFADREALGSDADQLLLDFIGSEAVTEAYKTVRHY